MLTTAPTANSWFLGYNLFAYAANNPINNSDPTGHGILKNLVKWVVSKVQPVVKKIQNSLKKVDKTHSQGSNYAVSSGLGSGYYQYCGSVDTKGNFAFQMGYGGGVTTESFGASAAVYRMTTNAPSVEKLNGPAYQVGGSGSATLFGVPMLLGVEQNIIPDDDEDAIYLGKTDFLGVGASNSVGEMHVEWGSTTTLFQFNIFEIFDNLYNQIMEW